MYATDESFAYSAMKDDDAKGIDDTSSRRLTLSAWVPVNCLRAHSRSPLGVGIGAQRALGVSPRAVDLGPG